MARLSVVQTTFVQLYNLLSLDNADLWRTFASSSQCEKEFPTTLMKKITPFQQVGKPTITYLFCFLFLISVVLFSSLSSCWLFKHSDLIVYRVPWHGLLPELLVSGPACAVVLHAISSSVSCKETLYNLPHIGQIAGPDFSWLYHSILWVGTSCQVKANVFLNSW